MIYFLATVNRHGRLYQPQWIYKDGERVVNYFTTPEQAHIALENIEYSLRSDYHVEAEPYDSPRHLDDRPRIGPLNLYKSSSERMESTCLHQINCAARLVAVLAADGYSPLCVLRFGKALIVPCTGMDPGDFISLKLACEDETGEYLTRAYRVLHDFISL